MGIIKDPSVSFIELDVLMKHSCRGKMQRNPHIVCGRCVCVCVCVFGEWREKDRSGKNERMGESQRTCSPI